jgi:hypothetical protein
MKTLKYGYSNINGIRAEDALMGAIRQPILSKNDADYLKSG